MINGLEPYLDGPLGWLIYAAVIAYIYFNS